MSEREVDCNNCGHVYLPHENIFMHDCRNPLKCDGVPGQPERIHSLLGCSKCNPIEEQTLTDDMVYVVQSHMGVEVITRDADKAIDRLRELQKLNAYKDKLDELTIAGFEVQ